MQNTNIKTRAHELIDQLPETVSWTELAYHVELRASVERGMEDVRAGRTLTSDEVKKRLGLTQ
ncbi:hypothetical protein [Bacterioplanoides sp.]|uniref:hypothetical protein n=1 Tax=Bacterioplanoides sp. TaxID=2066072 RepID=UPI003B00537E